MSDIPRIRLVQAQASDIRTPSESVAGVPALDSREPPTDEEVVDTLVVQNGIPVRAAAMLGVTEEYILRVVSRNTRLLSSKARSRLMLSSFATILKLDATLQANMADMPLDALGRTYAASMAAFTNLAGQFPEQEVSDDTDDATAAKEDMIERLERMGKREQLAQIEESSTG